MREIQTQKFAQRTNDLLEDRNGKPYFPTDILKGRLRRESFMPEFTKRFEEVCRMSAHTHYVAIKMADDILRLYVKRGVTEDRKKLDRGGGANKRVYEAMGEHFKQMTEAGLGALEAVGELPSNTSFYYRGGSLNLTRSNLGDDFNEGGYVGRLSDKGYFSKVLRFTKGVQRATHMMLEYAKTYLEPYAEKAQEIHGRATAHQKDHSYESSVVKLENIPEMVKFIVDNLTLAELRFTYLSEIISKTIAPHTSRSKGVKTILPGREEE